MSIETIPGNLRGCIIATNGNFQHSDEITQERITNPSLRNMWFYTGDHANYRCGQSATLYLGRLSTNPIVKNILGKRTNNSAYANIPDATEQLRIEENYFVPQQDIESVVNAPDTLKLEIKDLRLIKDNDKLGYIQVCPEKINCGLSSVQMSLLERIYGEGDKFKSAMEMFAQADNGNGINLNIYVLMPNYIKAKTQGGKMITRACRLSGFEYGSGFVPVVHKVSDRDAVRGLRYNAEADAQKK